MNQEIAHNLHSAAEVWGIEITRTEITDVIVDDAAEIDQHAAPPRPFLERGVAKSGERPAVHVALQHPVHAQQSGQFRPQRAGGAEIHHPGAVRPRQHGGCGQCGVDLADTAECHPKAGRQAASGKLCLQRDDDIVMVPF